MADSIECINLSHVSSVLHRFPDRFKQSFPIEIKNAGQIVREAGKLIQGGGGGQPHFATAGGKNAEGLKSAVDLIVELALA